MIYKGHEVWSGGISGQHAKHDSLGRELDEIEKL